MVEGKDYYYIDNGDGKRIVFTKEFLIKRGTCCSSKCLNCPYYPKHSGSREINKGYIS